METSDGRLRWGTAHALPLGHPDINPVDFGMKAAVLSRLKQSGVVAVPDGWCFRVDVSEPDYHRGRAVIDHIWGALGRPEHDMIARSSASIEDLPFALFAGRFASRGGIRSRAGLHAAVRQVVDSREGLAVRDYLRAFGLSSDCIQMAVIVQAQIPALYSGVSFTRSPVGFAKYSMFVEIIKGRGTELLTGESLGATYGLNDEVEVDTPGVRYEHIGGADYDQSETVILLPKVFEACRAVAEFLNADQDVEWVWDGQQVWVVQARELLPERPLDGPGYPLTSRDNVDPDPHLKSLPQSREWGMKGAAEDYFADLGLGASNCLLILPHEKLANVATQLSDRCEGAYGTVVRFSHAAQVGLPKRFVPNGGDVFEAFASLREGHPEWMGIISDYIFIASSFEAYVTGDSLLVEHVPGNWEPDNRLAPDLFMFTAHGCEVFRYIDYRDARVEAPGDGSNHHIITRRIAPISAGTCENWAQRFLSDFQRIRRDFIPDLPVNVHFIADERGRFYFLNIRPTARLDVVDLGRVRGDSYKANRYFTVSSPPDVANWDGVSRILVDCVADRGDESRIATLAVELRNAGVSTVFCTFGLLSHPAIVLREFQLRVEPLYIHHQPQSLDLRW